LRELLSREYGSPTTSGKVDMGIADRLKDLKTKATEATVERSDKIHEAVEKATAAADQHTGGKYGERLQKVGAKADSLVEGLRGTDTQAAAEGADPVPAEPAAGQTAEGAQDAPAQ
jgi:DNA-binding protein H-NS